MSIIVKSTHEYFNLNESMNPIVKALVEQPDDVTEQGKINAITGKNYLKIHEQHQTLFTLAKNMVRFELQTFKENVADRLRVKYLFAAFEELMDDDLNFADTIAVNKDTFLIFENAVEQNLNKVLTEFQRLYREFSQYSAYIDSQFQLYVKHIHDIVLLKCPEYLVEPMEDFPNTRRLFNRSDQRHPAAPEEGGRARAAAPRVRRAGQGQTLLQVAAADGVRDRPLRGGLRHEVARLFYAPVGVSLFKLVKLPLSSKQTAKATKIYQRMEVYYILYASP